MSEEAKAGTAFIFADFQKVIRDRVETLGKSVLDAYDSAAQNAAKLLQHAREEKAKGNSIVIVHLQLSKESGKFKNPRNFIPETDGSRDFSLLRPKFLKYSQLLEENEALAQPSSKELEPALEKDEYIILRPMMSGFHDTDLSEILKKKKVEKVVVAGVATSGAVLSTVLSAVDFGLGITVVKDGCMDTDEKIHPVLLELFTSRGNVLKVEEIIKG